MGLAPRQPQRSQRSVAGPAHAQGQFATGRCDAPGRNGPPAGICDRATGRGNRHIRPDRAAARQFRRSASQLRGAARHWPGSLGRRGGPAGGSRACRPRQLGGCGGGLRPVGGRTVCQAGGDDGPGRAPARALAAGPPAGGGQPVGARACTAAGPPGQPGGRGDDQPFAPRRAPGPVPQLAHRSVGQPGPLAPAIARHRGAGRVADAVAPGAVQGLCGRLRSAGVRPLHPGAGVDPHDGRVGQRRGHGAAQSATRHGRRRRRPDRPGPPGA